METRDISKAIKVPCTLESFFGKWVEILWYLHRLTPSEMDVLSCMLKERYLLSKRCQDKDILDNLLFQTETRHRIMKQCGVSEVSYSMKLKKFRDKGIIKDGALNPRLIPNIKEDAGSFTALFMFKFNEEGKPGKKK